MGNVNLGGSITIEGGSVIKATNSIYARINAFGAVVAKTGPYHPAIFTSMSDDSVGDQIANSTGNPVGYYFRGLQIYNSGDSLHDLRFCYAASGVKPPA